MALGRTAADHPGIVAVRNVDDAVSWTWRELLSRADALAAGLSKPGFRPDDRAALMLINGPEFSVADLAAITPRATPFSIDNIYPQGEVTHLLNDARAVIIVTSRHSSPPSWPLPDSFPACVR